MPEPAKARARAYIQSRRPCPRFEAKESWEAARRIGKRHAGLALPSRKPLAATATDARFQKLAPTSDS
jgi:hypothetical protein